MVAPTRTRICITTSTPLDFPAEVFGIIQDFLPYSDVRSFLSACKVIRCEAAKYVQVLHVHESSELHSRFAKRFPHVTEVNVNCLLEWDAECHRNVNWKDCLARAVLSTNTAFKMAPFLESFPRLQRVHIGGAYANIHSRLGYVCCSSSSDTKKSSRNQREQFHAFLKELCMAISVGTVSESLIVH